MKRESFKQIIPAPEGLFAMYRDINDTYLLPIVGIGLKYDSSPVFLNAHSNGEISEIEDIICICNRHGEDIQL